MRKILSIALFLLSVCAVHAQVVVGNQSGFVIVQSAPSGSCTNGQQPQLVFATGIIYTCQSGTWAPSSGSGTISGVTAGTGTTGGGTSGNVTLSLATTYQLPQSCSNTQGPTFNAGSWICSNVISSVSAPLSVSTGNIALAGSSGLLVGIGTSSQFSNSPTVGVQGSSQGSIALAGDGSGHSGLIDFEGSTSGFGTITAAASGNQVQVSTGLFAAGVPGTTAGTAEIAGNGAGTSGTLQIDGGTSGNATLSVTATGSVLNLNASNPVEIPSLTAGQEFTLGTNSQLGNTYQNFHNSSTALSSDTGAQLMALITGSGQAGVGSVSLDPGSTTTVSAEMDVGTSTIPQTVFQNGGVVNITATGGANGIVLGNNGVWRGSFAGTGSAGNLISVGSSANVTSVFTNPVGSSSTTFNLQGVTIAGSNTAVVSHGLIWPIALEGKGVIRDTFVEGINGTCDLEMEDSGNLDINNFLVENSAFLGSGNTGCSVQAINAPSGTGQGSGYVFNNVSVGDQTGTIYNQTVNFDGSAAWVTGTVNTSNGALGGCSSNCAQATSGTFSTTMPAGSVININGTYFNTNAVPVDSTHVQLTSAPGTQTGVTFFGVQSGVVSHALKNISWTNCYDEESTGSPSGHLAFHLKNVQNVEMGPCVMGAGTGMANMFGIEATATNINGRIHIFGRTGGHATNFATNSSSPFCTANNTPIPTLCTGVNTLVDSDNNGEYESRLSTDTWGHIFDSNVTVVGTLTIPTAPIGTNTNQAATTAFVLANSGPPGWLTYYGDGSTGAGNITSNQNLSGINDYTTFSCSAVITDNANNTPLIIQATTSITLSTGCSIVATGIATATGDAGGSGGGGGGGAASGTAGSPVRGITGGAYGAVLNGGTAGGASTVGGTGNAFNTGFIRGFINTGFGSPEASIIGGSAGGQGGSAGGAGGNGGGVIILIAPVITIASGVTLTSNGNVGTAGGTNTGGGGGGGGGVIIVRSPNLTDNGAVFSTAAGNGGAAGTGTTAAGGPGGAGWSKEIAH